jgi:hypothetical protein
MILAKPTPFISAFIDTFHLPFPKRIAHEIK